MNKIKLHQYLVESKKRITAYNRVLNEVERTFRELNSQNIQATLIQIEDFFDTNNLYAFNNWFEGNIWDGPNVNRYWIEITLQYSEGLMPEPRGLARFAEMGVKYKFIETTIMTPMKVEKPDDLDPATRKPKEKKEKIWLITLKIPRYLIEDPMPNDSEEADTIQNIEATKEAENEDMDEEDMDEEDMDDEEKSGGDDLEL